MREKKRPHCERQRAIIGIGMMTGSDTLGKLWLCSSAACVLMRLCFGELRPLESYDTWVSKVSGGEKVHCWRSERGQMPLCPARPGLLGCSSLVSLSCPSVADSFSRALCLSALAASPASSRQPATARSCTAGRLALSASLLSVLT